MNKSLVTYNMQIKQKRLLPIVEIDDSLMTTPIVLDSRRLQQVLLNLISNAVKFTYTGYIKVKVEQVPYDIVSFDNPDSTQAEEPKNK